MKYNVDVSWRMVALIEVEAETCDEAVDLALQGEIRPDHPHYDPESYAVEHIELAE
jgi:hypothetical protein